MTQNPVRKLYRHLATASGAKRWMACPTSVALGATISETKKKYATKGTELHQKAAKWLKLLTDPEISHVEGYNHLEPEVSLYINSIINRLTQLSSQKIDCRLNIEERLPFLGSSGGIDCYIIAQDKAWVYDLKTGEGVKVFATKNEQLAFYACAVAENHPEINHVTATIVQPSIEDDAEMPHVDSWELTEEVLAEWTEKFKVALELVDQPYGNQMPLVVGSYCQFCKAQPICPAHMKILEEADSDLPVAIEPLQSEKLPIQADRIIHILKHKKHINAWFEKAEEYLFLRMKEGGEQADELINQGCKLARKRSYRRWREDLSDAQIIEALEARDIKSPSKTKPLNITEIEKTGVNIDDLVEKPEGEECVRFE